MNPITGDEFISLEMGKETATATTPLGDIIIMPLARRGTIADSNDHMFTFNGVTSFVVGWEGTSDRFHNPSGFLQFTVEASFFIDRASTDGMTLLSWGTSSGNTIRVFYDAASGSMCVAPMTASQAVHCTAGRRVDDDKWHHIMVSLEYDATRPIPGISHVYLDGHETSMASDVSMPPVTYSFFYIGTWFPSLPYQVTKQVRDKQIVNS
jgi:hypothetical protein